jgi:ubiquinone/menaquinone biosynthesis C-methylase UbiE
MSDNAQQVEFWNGPSGQRWASLQETTDRSLAFVTAALIPFAAAAKGERVLDVGCGCASTSLALANAVGSTGRVAGIDISAPMLAVARARAKANANVGFLEADASVHVFEPEFDLVFSRFGVMFFSEPAAAFSNIRKALAPDGRLVFVCWRSMAANVWAFAPLAAARDLLPPQEPMDPNAPGPFAFADDARVRSVLEQAGFRDARVERLDTVMNLGADLAEAVQASLSIGPLSRIASQLGKATLEAVRVKVRAALAPFQTPAGIAPPAACWLVSARK